MYLCYISSVVLYFSYFFLINYCSFMFCIIIANGLTASQLSRSWFCFYIALPPFRIYRKHSDSFSYWHCLYFTTRRLLMVNPHQGKHWFAWMELVFVHLLILFILVSTLSLARNAAICVRPPNSQRETSSVLTFTNAQSVKVRQVLGGAVEG